MQTTQHYELKNQIFLLILYLQIKLSFLYKKQNKNDVFKGRIFSYLSIYNCISFNSSSKFFLQKLMGSF